jgi:hypothetical protein
MEAVMFDEMQKPVPPHPRSAEYKWAPQKEIPISLRAVYGRVFSAAIAALVLAGSGGQALAQDYTSDWREEFAYTLGMQAYIYGFPWINMAQLRWLYVTQPPTATNDHPYAPLNKFCHSTTVKDSSWQGGGNPNSDTVYSTAWLNLTTEPVVLSVPAMDRYYTFEFSCMDSDNYAYVGTRATGTNAGSYLIVGPDWHGTYPTNEMTPLPPSRTPYTLLWGRTILYGPDDVTNVHAIQAQYKLTPLSYWGTTNEPPDDRNVWAPDDSTNGLAAWYTLNRALTENPPNVPSQQSMVNYFGQIGVGPGANVDAMDDATQAGLRRAAINGWNLLNQYLTNGVLPSSYFVTNGWIFSPADEGRAGQYDDFLLRAAGQSLEAIVDNDPVEAVYLYIVHDATGQWLSGTNNYTITFPPNGLPDVGAFWSITLYDMNGNMVSNPINRYKVGTYPTNSLTFNADGSLRIYVQNTSPGPDKESNWLPAPAGGFHFYMRLYLPGPDILNHTWGPPPVVRVLSPPQYRLLSLSLTNDIANLTWTDAPGLRFQVQYASQLSPTAAMPWVTAPGEITSADGHYLFQDDGQQPARFYRVLQLR